MDWCRAADLKAFSFLGGKVYNSSSFPESLFLIRLCFNPLSETTNNSTREDPRVLENAFIKMSHMEYGGHSCISNQEEERNIQKNGHNNSHSQRAVLDGKEDTCFLNHQKGSWTEVERRLREVPTSYNSIDETNKKSSMEEFPNHKTLSEGQKVGNSTFDESEEEEFGDFQGSADPKSTSHSKEERIDDANEEDDFADFASFEQESRLNEILLLSDEDLQNAFGEIKSQRVSDSTGFNELLNKDMFGPDNCSVCGTLIHTRLKRCLFCGLKAPFHTTPPTELVSELFQIIDESTDFKSCTVVSKEIEEGQDFDFFDEFANSGKAKAAGSNVAEKEVQVNTGSDGLESVSITAKASVRTTKSTISVEGPNSKIKEASDGACNGEAIALSPNKAKEQVKDGILSTAIGNANTPIEPDQTQDEEINKRIESIPAKLRSTDEGEKSIKEEDSAFYTDNTLQVTDETEMTIVLDAQVESREAFAQDTETTENLLSMAMQSICLAHTDEKVGENPVASPEVTLDSKTKLSRGLVDENLLDLDSMLQANAPNSNVEVTLDKDGADGDDQSLELLA